MQVSFRFRRGENTGQFQVQRKRENTGQFQVEERENTVQFRGEKKKYRSISGLEEKIHVSFRFRGRERIQVNFGRRRGENTDQFWVEWGRE